MFTMKTLPCIFLSFVVSFLAATILSGCAKDEAKSVDINANINALKRDDKDARANACVELGKAKAKAAPAVPALIPLLKDKDAEVRRLASYSLGEIGPPASAALEPLRELLKDPDR